ncbi:MAG TPA: prolyl oligopeptidase family serine peptidase [Chloroflexota bacterium]
MSEQRAIPPERIDFAGDIPALAWRATGSPPHPVIVSLHGLGGSKQDIDPDIAAYVTAHGITLVTLDAHLHGDRAPAGGFDLDRFKEPEGFADLITHTAHDVVALVAQLKEDPTVGTIGLRGGSVGGFIVLAAVGLGAEVGAVVSVCGGADWAHTLVRVDDHEPVPVALQSAVQADPILHPERFAPKPVLLMHGLYDDTVPIAGHRQLYEALAPYYRERPGDCLFLTHAGQHPTPMSLEAFGWTWLVEKIR